MMGVRHKMEAPPGQTISSPGAIIMTPGTPRVLNLVRHRTMDFEVWGVVEDPTSSVAMISPGCITKINARRSKSEIGCSSIDKVNQNIQGTNNSQADGSGQAENVRMVPVLGPNRQQTDIYIKEKDLNHRSNNIKRHNILPIDGPSHNMTIGGHLPPDSIPVFDNKAANAVLLDAESQLKSGFPTIATSSVVARRNRNVQLSDEFDSQPDMRFFSELVKPMQYRWRFQNNKLRTILPSKIGFHPRSKSPTFQRLVEATEKLQILAEVDEVIYVEKHQDELFETQSQVMSDVTEKPVINRYIKSEPSSTRGSMTRSITSSRDQNKSPGEFKPEVRTLEPIKKETQDTFYEDEDDEEDDYDSKYDDEKEEERHVPKQRDFKVDFKKTDSHSELHLFLPHILDAYSRGPTPDNSLAVNQNNKHVLPSLGEIKEQKSSEEDKNRQRRINSQKNNNKNKKKKSNRIKSGCEDKEVRDRLNDVPTLISLEKEKVETHPASMCVFENCQYHQHKKSTKLRQP